MTRQLSSLTLEQKYSILLGRSSYKSYYLLSMSTILPSLAFSLPPSGIIFLLMQSFSPHLSSFFPFSTPTLHSSLTLFLLHSHTHSFQTPVPRFSRILPSSSVSTSYSHFSSALLTVDNSFPLSLLLALCFLPTLHSMQPAIRSMIPVRVKNSYNPSAVGTAITSKR